MDYKQWPRSGINQSSQPFFTEGVGNIPTNQNDFFTPNLDNEGAIRDANQHANRLSPDGESLPPTRERPLSPDSAPKRDTETIEITPLPTSNTGESSVVVPSFSFDPNLIHTKGDKVNPATLKEVKRTITELERTGNAAGFYPTIRDMARINLDNSYNRKVN